MNQTTKIRSEDDLAVDQFSYFASRAKRFRNGTKITDSELEYKAPEGDLSEDVLNFNLEAQPNQSLSFMDEYQLRVEARFTCKVQKYTTADFTTTTGGEITETLCPTRHRLMLGPSLNILNLFDKCTVSFNGVYPEQSNSWDTQDVSWLNKMANVEHSFVSSPSLAETRRQYGFFPGINPELAEMETVLSSQLEQWGMSASGETGKRVYYGRIPCFPFRGLSPVRERELQRNLGGDVLMKPMIPPGVDVRVALRKSKIPLLNLLFHEDQDYTVGSENKKNDDAKYKEWLNKTAFGIDATKTEYLRVISVSVEMSKVELVYKRMTGSLFTDKPLTNFFTCYRSVLSKLENSSVQKIQLVWDVAEQPTAVYFFFIRDYEYHFKEANKLSVSPCHAYRPKTLKKLVVYDNSTPQRVLYQNFELDNLNQEKTNDKSWLRYEEYMIRNRFLQHGVHTRRFFNAKQVITDTVLETGDRGNFSIFPLDLTGLKTKKESKHPLGKREIFFIFINDI